MLGDREFRLDSVESRGDHVVVSFSWADKEGQRHNWAQALRLRDDKIIDIEDFASVRLAVASMRLRTAFG